MNVEIVTEAAQFQEKENMRFSLQCIRNIISRLNSSYHN
jgi:hypothetical protein